MTVTVFPQAYRQGLADLLDDGSAVPSVLDPLSKASGFGAGDRPYREIIGHAFRVRNTDLRLASSEAMPVNLAYCLGLLAWSLDGRNDVETLAYYRRGAHEYSDDEHTLSGAFGNRLLRTEHGDQISAIVERIRRDPAHRRTFAMVLRPQDNFVDSREYPCAVGVQLFLRDGALTWLTVMRAQQALTVLPYDAFLFMGLHQVAAGLLDAATGPYLHQSGTFHFYADEAERAAAVAGSTGEIVLPGFPTGRDAVRRAVDELVVLEHRVRTAAGTGDRAAIEAAATAPRSCELTRTAAEILTDFARTKVGSGAAMAGS